MSDVNAAAEKIRHGRDAMEEENIALGCTYEPHQSTRAALIAGIAAHDALVAENQRLQEALRAWESDAAISAGVAAMRKLLVMRVGDQSAHAEAFRVAARAALEGE